ncbi:hypothetical protein EVAR_58813_1 [Eumeta japonica]|uniref:Uncharacterized protein n=1 Tax=Eumeta variegata TaxID=151549 RepID=A0A4C1YKX4_EUMVA|nr:hypothetical protein EVAR_58813_1 [Eumeta japonica]
MKYFFVLFAYALICIGAKRELGCSRRIHVARAEQQDEFGRKCWDYIKFTSCGGWCDSSESSNFDVKYEPQSGRFVMNKVDAILEKVEQERRISPYYIAEELEINHKTVSTHLKRPGIQKKTQYLGPT